MVQTKICKKCERNLTTQDYYKSSRSWCKKCHSQYIMEKRKENPEKYKKYLKDTWAIPSMIFARKKANAKKEGIVFSLEKEKFIKWYENQDLRCNYCTINPKNFKKTQDNYLLKKINLGLDRKNNNQGYDFENIVLCCNRCNIIKGGFFTYEEMKLIGQNFVKPKWVEKKLDLN
mgnify:FL=1